jgi:AAA15 family ATPase/GTPase
MLIRFTVENFRSFNEEIVFSMLPGRAQKHPEHIISGKGHGADVLSLALLYGANASGKSNLVRAMDFARQFIIKGTRPKQAIPVETFRLDKSCVNRPSRFEFEFIVDDKAYAYGFETGRLRVDEEWLYEIDAKRDKVLFERRTDDKGVTQATFGDKVKTGKDDGQFLDFVTRGTRPNQLFLTAAAENNIQAFEPVFEWFRSTLSIIFPHSRASGIEIRVHEDQEFSQALAVFLHGMGTGVDEVCTQPVDPESIDLPLELIGADLDLDTSYDQSGETVPKTEERMLVVNGLNGERYLLRRDETGALETNSLSTRRRINGDAVTFDIFEESDGTQRLLDLFPILHSAKAKVFVIDELERSLHPTLARRFIQDFLAGKKHSQLIVTTHESTLLNLGFLRRDEIWFVEKSPKGASTVYSLEAFKPRHDLDIRKGYLHGRFGAIPVFGGSLYTEREYT